MGAVICRHPLYLTQWGRVTHICVSKPTTIGSNNGLSPGRHQAIIWTNAGILLIGPLGTNLSEILSEIHIFSLKKMHLKMSSGKWRPFCLCLNVLNLYIKQKKNKSVVTNHSPAINLHYWRLGDQAIDIIYKIESPLRNHGIRFRESNWVSLPAGSTLYPMKYAHASSVLFCLF